MGQVYRATDTQLGRDVALKILPDAFAADPDRLARFQREAQVLASLNHPNIAQIYGIEEGEPSSQQGVAQGSSPAVRALVLELVEGPTLADRIALGAMPIEDALPIARQIAEALEAAHEAGVIHRDLKPANIKVREDGTVKVLDFGLAKALDTTPDGDPSQSPTLTAAATQMGVIMGTAAYMSPEQARGKPVDKRADIWAFGCVLYEMLIRQKPFGGDDVSTTLARVIEREPDWDVLPGGLPPVLRSFVKRCLSKDPQQRVHDVTDLRLALESVFESSERMPSRPTAAPAGLLESLRPGPVLLAAGLGAVVAAVIMWTTGRALDAPSTVRLEIQPPPGGTLAHTDFAVSPDGRDVVFGATLDGQTALYRRSIDDLAPVVIRGTENGSHPFVSPDGEWLAFAAEDELRRVRIEGGPPSTLCRCDARGGSYWTDDDEIVFGGPGSGLRAIPASGGEPRVVTRLPDGAGTDRYPVVLPGGRTILFSRGYGDLEAGEIVAFSRDTGELKVLTLGHRPHVTESGDVVFARADGSLWSAAFDPARLELVEEPAPAARGLTISPTDGTLFELSGPGTLVYARGNARPTRSLVWVSRAGEPTRIRDEVNPRFPRLSPDGTRVAYDATSETGTQVVWVHDLARGSQTLIALEGLNAYDPSWHPDGIHLVFGSGGGRSGSDLTDLFTSRADGSGEPELLKRLPGWQFQPSWAPDGKTLVFRSSRGEDNPSREGDIWMATAEGDTVPLIEGEADEAAPSVSRNGRWLAYSSDQSGQSEIYVTSFPDVGVRETVSAGGGTQPAWSADGTHLFYRNEDQWWNVEIEDRPTFAPSAPELLFEYAAADLGMANRNYAVAPDGRFLTVANDARGDAVESSIVVVLNWEKEFERRVRSP